MKLDAIDCRILNELQEDGRLSNQDLADKVALSPSACLRRVKILEEQGAIDRYQAILSPKKLGYELDAIVHISMEKSGEDWHEAFMSQIKKFDEIIQAHVVTGGCNYIVYVRTKTLSDFSEFIVRQLYKVNGISDICSYIVLETVKQQSKLRL